MIVGKKQMSFTNEEAPRYFRPLKGNYFPYSPSTRIRAC
jgi:hypothetical protein